MEINKNMLYAIKEGYNISFFIDNKSILEIEDIINTLNKYGYECDIDYNEGMILCKKYKR